MSKADHQALPWWISLLQRSPKYPDSWACLSHSPDKTLQTLRVSSSSRDQAERKNIFFNSIHRGMYNIPNFSKSFITDLRERAYLHQENTFQTKIHKNYNHIHQLIQEPILLLTFYEAIKFSITQFSSMIWNLLETCTCQKALPMIFLKMKHFWQNH